MADELFDVRNLFTLGNYASAVNAAISLRPSSSAASIDRDVYLYRCYVCQRNFGLVLAETDGEKGSDPSIAAVRTLALFKKASGDANMEKEPVEEVQKWIDSGSAVSNSTQQVVAGIILMSQNKIDEAMKVLHNSLSLEAMSLMVQCYLMMNRVDLAETQLRTMQRTDDDATLTQLAATRFYLAQGGERIGDALAILNDLSDKYGATPAVLSAQAVCSMRTGNFVEAEKLLLQASERAITEPEVFVNLAVCALHTGKPKEVVDRYITQLRAMEPNHPWLASKAEFEKRFDDLVAASH